MSELSELYQQVILDHNKKPRNFHKLEHANRAADPVELKIRFLVRAELVCHPVHVPVEFVADIVDGGKIIVNRL